MTTRFHRSLWPLFLVSLTWPAWAYDDTFPPEELLRANGYEGPQRPPGETATVFAMDGRPRYESAYICKVDGKVLERNGQCASVAYLLPGRHTLSLRYRSATESGTGDYTLDVGAGKTYQLNVSSLRTQNTGLMTSIPMPARSRLTFRNLAPGLAAGSPRADEEVPHGPN